MRSVSSSDSRLLALDELSVELEEVELLEAPGGGPGGGPGRRAADAAGPPRPLGASPLAELWLPSDATPPSCDRKAQHRRRQADRGRRVGGRDRAARLTQRSTRLRSMCRKSCFWLAQFASSSRNNWACELKPEMDIDMVCPQTSPQGLTRLTLTKA